ncbi:MAG: MFS transporter [Dactylosporangium sp.]|nr:MFS transporter [Dactylosporangium sp.]NNJ62075.1 MFS transporter [Dactylosporangium sp.]
MTEYPTRRWAALAVLSMASVVITLDTTVLNVALPTLARDLHATTSELQWFASSYLLVLAVMLLPAGLLGDLVGRKPMTLTSLAIFGLGSAWSAYAGSPAALIAARVTMGAGAALLLPLTYSWLIALFPDDERPKAMGVLGGAGFVGMPLGPIVGGWLLDRYFWGSVFLINVPAVLVAMVAGLVLLPGGGRLPGRRIDTVGIALSVVGLAALTYGMIEAPGRGWTDPIIVATAVGGMIVLAAFVGWERRLTGATALMDMSLWRLPAFSWGVGSLALATLLGIVAMFTMPQYFSAVLEVDALGTGLRLMPLLGGIVLGIVAGVALSERSGYKVAVVAGLACVLAGGLLAVRTGVDTGYGWAAGWLTLLGLGLGAVTIAGNNLALNTLDETRAGAGGAIVQVMRQTGSVIGIAALGSVLNASYRDSIDVERLPGALADTARDSAEAGLAVAHRLGSPDLALAVKHAFLDGLHIQMWLSAALAAACILGTLIAMPARLGKTRTEAHLAQEHTREHHRA